MVTNTITKYKTKQHSLSIEKEFSNNSHYRSIRPKLVCSRLFIEEMHICIHDRRNQSGFNEIDARMTRINQLEYLPKKPETEVSNCSSKHELDKASYLCTLSFLVGFVGASIFPVLC